MLGILAFVLKQSEVIERFYTEEHHDENQKSLGIAHVRNDDGLDARVTWQQTSTDGSERKGWGGVQEALWVGQVWWTA